MMASMLQQTLSLWLNATLALAVIFKFAYLPNSVVSLFLKYDYHTLKMLTQHDI
jgi:hypothetical protein